MIGIMVLTNNMNSFSNVNAAQQHSRLIRHCQQGAVTTLTALLGWGFPEHLCRALPAALSETRH